jgi:DNA-binding cell septation regulator SpoVG
MDLVKNNKLEKSVFLVEMRVSKNNKGIFITMPN